jgi:integrase
MSLTGMRRSELAHLKVGDIDSQRMIIRVVAGKRSQGSRFTPESGLTRNPAGVLVVAQAEALPVSTRTLGCRLDRPICDKTVWIACSEAARRAGIPRGGRSAMVVPTATLSTPFLSDWRIRMAMASR